MITNIKQITYLGVTALLFTGSPTYALPATDLNCTSCVDNTEIAPNTITSSRIQNLAVGNSDIANNAITTQKIKNFSIRTVDLAISSVTSGRIAPGAVQNSDIGANAVTTDKIATGAVTTTDIASGAVAESKLSGLVQSKLNNGPGIEYSQQSSFGTTYNVPTTWTNIRTLTMTLPSSGYVTCTASGTAIRSISAGSFWFYMGWDRSITAGVPADSYTILRGSGLATNTAYIPTSMTQTYPVAAGTNRFYLKVRTNGASTDYDVSIPSATCMFFPNRY